MGDYRQDTITDLMRQMRDLAGKLHEMLLPEIMSYEMLQADVERKRGEMAQVNEQKKVALIEIETAKQTAESIKNMAKDEAQVIIQNGKNVMVENLNKVNKLLSDVESFVHETDKKRYNALRKESEKLAA